MPVSGLKLKDFHLLDNGQPQKIVSFRGFDEFGTKPNPPVEVILVIDTLEMPPTLVSRERISVEAFLRERAAISLIRRMMGKTQMGAASNDWLWW
jgi:hypothetical protein